jgi:hypothetical protein
MAKAAAPSIDDVRIELERVLKSETFSRADRSQQFLQYVCDLALKGESSKINQYLIGFEVFGRGSEYSTAEDSLVRRQAHVLRQRLDTYYAGEGRTDPVRIRLPLGHYVPEFESQIAFSASAPAHPPRVRGQSVASLRATLLLAVFVGIGCGVAGWFIGRSAAAPGQRAESERRSAVREIWGHWLEDASGATICFSNTMAAVVNPQAEPLTSPDLPRWLADAEAERCLRQVFTFPNLKYIYLTPAVVNTKMGEAIGAVRLAGLFSSSGSSVSATESRLLTWQDFRKQNLILFGHNEYNPFVDPILERYPLRLGRRGERAQRYIVNGSPLAGESSEYKVRYPEGNGSLKTEPTREYALISMIPSLVRNRRLLLINGLDTQATQMAVGFLVDPEPAQTLLDRLRLSAPGHQGPWYFQAVVETEVRDKVPLGARVVAVRSSDTWPRPSEVDISHQAAAR